VIFTPTKLPGVFVVDPEPVLDERGVFARIWCQRDFEARRLSGRLVQCSVSFNSRAGTLRGMHYQTAPHAEAKLIRCTMGAIYDVALDLRSGSPTFRKWIAIELSADSRRMVYLPEGIAHGFQTLTDRSEVFYQISEFFEPSAARGVRWDDPAFGIEWPPGQRIISPRDLAYPDFVA